MDFTCWKENDPAHGNQTFNADGVAPGRSLRGLIFAYGDPGCEDNDALRERILM